jgi:outer membrane protein OmpA-like peptidoglycan-associated protein
MADARDNKAACLQPPLAKRQHWAALLALLVAVFSSTSAHAQSLGGQRFQPAGSEDGVLGTEGADRRVPLHPYVALWMHYALNPVIFVDRDGEKTGEVVKHLLAADVIASLAVWEGLEFGVGLPVTLLGSGDPDDANAAGLEEPGLSLGDVVVRAGWRQRFGDDTALALHVPVLLPTSGEDNVLGLGLGVRPTLALMQRFGIAELLFNLSYLVRGAERALDFDGGQELGARAAARIALDSYWKTGVLAELGFSTATSDFFAAPVTPVEARVGVDHWFGEHWRLTGFLGTGLSTGVGAPDVRAGLGIAYGDNPPYRARPAPTRGDRDGDGIRDETDRCPDAAEDRDGFQDGDGCPEDDNDADGVIDVDDSCPRAPETLNGISDDDGCPDHIVLEETLITTFEPVYFKSDSEVIEERSFPMLKEIGGVLRINPGMQIRVEGHSDAQGDDEYNRKLSERRADSVRTFLLENGASRGQVEAEGVGERRPIASNETAEGRSKNRRVEFHIVRDEE